MITHTCPKCNHTWSPPPTWRSYLSKASGEHYRLHFYSNKGTSAVPRATRTRLYFLKTTKLDTIIAALELTAVEHAHDPFFRWCDTPEGTLASMKRHVERLVNQGS
jgi:hypothetical protein